jgi:predicted Ser/Thr protein kinase
MQRKNGGDTVAKLTKDQRFMLDYAEGRLPYTSENQTRFCSLLEALNAKKAALQDYEDSRPNVKGETKQ